MLRFLEHRIGDQRILRLVQKWLKAGVLEDGTLHRNESGTPQGGSVSPFLANVYLHYVFDLWIQSWRRSKAKGDVVVVRWADDFIVGFQYEWEAKRFLAGLKERFRKFGLELHPEKTKLIEFGRYAASNRKRRGQRKPETFDFLGFTHICGKTLTGKFMVLRKTMKNRLRDKLKELKDELRKRINEPVPVIGRWLNQVVRGYYQYHAIPMNLKPLESFRHQVVRLWCRTLRRRSHKHKCSWQRMTRLATQYLPHPRVLHPYPTQQFGVIT
jgi:RNA-directed DNA polymerase